MSWIGENYLVQILCQSDKPSISYYISFIIIIIIIIIITMAPLSEVTGSCAFVAVGDWTTGRATILSILMCPPEPSGRQSGDLGEKWRL
jgi:hypothetical protein